MKAAVMVLMALAAAVAAARVEAYDVTIHDVVVREGQPAAFIIELSEVPAAPVSVDWVTQDVTAAAGADYVAASGTAVFNGRKIAVVSVATLGDDSVAEGAELFYLRLVSTSPNAAIADGVGHGVIEDADVSPPVRCDLDGDGYADLMAWYDPSHPNEPPQNHNPQHQDWGGPGSVPQDPVSVPENPSLPTPWSIVAMNDFDGDGSCDVVWRLGHALKVTLTPDTTGAMPHEPGPTDPAFTLPSGWTVVGSGDINADEIADLVLWNRSSRGMTVWFGPKLLTGASLTPVPAGGDPAAVANLDGTGLGILWWSSPGTLAYSNVAGLTIGAPSALSGSHSNLLTPAAKVVAVGDYNRDGFEDLVLQEDDGPVVIWFMQGTTRLGETFTSPERLVLNEQAGVVRGPR